MFVLDLIVLGALIVAIATVISALMDISRAASTRNRVDAVNAKLNALLSERGIHLLEVEVPDSVIREAKSYLKSRQRNKAVAAVSESFGASLEISSEIVRRIEEGQKEIAPS